MNIWQWVLIQIFSFVLVIGLLRWILYRDIVSTINRLKQLNQENLEKEDELKHELKNAKSVCAEEIKKGKEEAERIRQEAKIFAQAVKEEAEAAAKHSAQKIMTIAGQEKQRIRQKFIAGIEAHIVELAFDLIKYIFTHELKLAIHKELTDELMQHINGIIFDKIELKNVNDVTVTTTYPLTKEQENLFHELLSKKIGTEIIMHKKIDKNITAGIIVEFSGRIIDGSLQSKLDKSLPRIKEAIKGKLLTENDK
ncbi:MAG: F0F1 ATP synthase subunit delta [Candidatus Omnitrophota bacterium]